MRASFKLPETLSAQVGSEVRRPEAPGTHLVLQRAQQDLDLLALRLLIDLLGPEQIEGLDLLLDERPYPLQLSFELSIGLKVPAHFAPSLQVVTRGSPSTCWTQPTLRPGP